MNAGDDTRVWPAAWGPLSAPVSSARGVGAEIALDHITRGVDSLECRDLQAPKNFEWPEIFEERDDDEDNPEPVTAADGLAWTAAEIARSDAFWKKWRRGTR